MNGGGVAFSFNGDGAAGFGAVGAGGGDLEWRSGCSHCGLIVADDGGRFCGLARQVIDFMGNFR